MSANPSSSTRRQRSGLGLVGSMKRTLDSGEFSDVQFTVGRCFGPVKAFDVHKHVLCQRSPVFYTMFYGSLPEKRQVIDIPDVLPDAFANMLSFLYTDTVDLRVDVVIQTLLCADKYEVPLLVDKCCEFVSTQLNTENCLIFLKNGVERRAEKIAESCLQFIDRSADDVIALGDFAAVGKEMLEMILLRNTLSAEEHNMSVDLMKVHA
ncbi:BTB/POZ domain-containing protein 6-like isoform X1 [Paramacrobiotus metropolitanus]|uniref:BTB/POZ domain-containing protein 6-like isoform X1 n=1 Tax=Paramacrobiotus metropolitanus TaxID=2943436 RepID=UPI002445F84D|nr:BTB/POZ domain-containing protein 6-like isoform X1 [Paramacrobiotus metropolitanus]XP_055347391.1 BTB/POZ domain-containing protein 6-like isoform X1 [Paramacrobiotus metropolitanus]